MRAPPCRAGARHSDDGSAHPSADASSADPSDRVCGSAPSPEALRGSSAGAAALRAADALASRLDDGAMARHDAEMAVAPADALPKGTQRRHGERPRAVAKSVLLAFITVLILMLEIVAWRYVTLTVELALPTATVTSTVPKPGGATTRTEDIADALVSVAAAATPADGAADGIVDGEGDAGGVGAADGERVGDGVDDDVAFSEGVCDGVCDGVGGSHERSVA